MENWKEYLIKKESNLFDAIKKLDKHQCIFVVDNNMKLLGTITDRDVRKAILNKDNKDTKVVKIMNNNPKVIQEPLNNKDLKNLFKDSFYENYPVVDKFGKIIDVRNNEELQRITYDNPVIIMAGGLGKRLAPLTDDLPKPMLKVGGQPLIATLLDEISFQGFKNVFISINYKANMIKNFVQDGRQWNLNVTYIEEVEPSGTAGSLSLIKDQIKKSIILINGDLLTKINFKSFLDFHEQKNSLLTLGVREYEFKIPYGIVDVKNSKAHKLIEKPMIKHFINAGIYAINPSLIKDIPDKTFFDITDLIDPLIKKKLVYSYPIYEYWIDIGKMDDFIKAGHDYPNYFVK